MKLIQNEKAVTFHKIFYSRHPYYTNPLIFNLATLAVPWDPFPKKTQKKTGVATYIIIQF